MDKRCDSETSFRTFGRGTSRSVCSNSNRRLHRMSQTTSSRIDSKTLNGETTMPRRTDQDFRKYLDSFRQGKKIVERSAVMIDTVNVQSCVRCEIACHSNMIESRFQRIQFVETGLCPRCQDESFWG